MKRTSTILISAAILLALPFWAILLLVYPLRALYALGIQAPLLEWLLGAPRFFATLLLADLPRDAIISATALVAAIAAAGALRSCLHLDKLCSVHRI